MTDFHSPDGPLPHVPDDLTLAQFILDHKHSIKPVRPDGVPWLIEDASGQELTYEQVSNLFCIVTEKDVRNLSSVGLSDSRRHMTDELA